VNFYYKLARFLHVIFFRIFYNLKVKGLENIPKTGGLFLASNHASYFDPPLIGTAIPNREVHFIARSTLFKNIIFSKIIKTFNAHPIERGKGPDQNWEYFINLLKQGAVLVVFPEGTRTPDGNLQRGKSGFGRLVYLSKMPVYPVYIKGSYAAWPKGKRPAFKPITVIFGKKVDLNDLLSLPHEKKVLKTISQRVMQAIEKLSIQDN